MYFDSHTQLNDHISHARTHARTKIVLIVYFSLSMRFCLIKKRGGQCANNEFFNARPLFRLHLLWEKISTYLAFCLRACICENHNYLWGKPIKIKVHLRARLFSSALSASIATCSFTRLTHTQSQITQALRATKLFTPPHDYHFCPFCIITAAAVV